MRNSSLIGQQTNVFEYLQALKKSTKYGPQVVCHRSFPEEKGKYVPFPSSLNDKLVTSLMQQGIENLYEHQGQAYQLIKSGNNVLVATPTSSGKSLIYNLPVLESIFTNRSARALYLFPLKALAQDQLRVLKQFESLFEADVVSDPAPLAAIYDGDTSPWQRQQIRKNLPNIIITNPDMLHLSFLPYHANWAHFFKQLQYIIIDEVHIYRGVFGAHMSWVLRRLQRVLAVYNVHPIFVLLSATIGNPEQFGERLIGKPVKSLTKSSAPRPKRNMLFLNPWDSAAHTISQLLEASLKRGLRTIVYTGSRKMAELITMWTKPRLGKLAPKLSSYRSGFLPEERRIIEKDLSCGKLLGVISTSALELGIDIGDLDICILAGYPGSIMTTWQRGGRVGRGGRESAIILVAQEDALDQYYMQNHDDFFARAMESAILNPFNPEIMEQHLHCAAAEVTIDQREMSTFPDAISKAVEQLTWKGILLQGSDGKEWFATRKFPQRQVSLRGGTKQLQIIRQDNGVILGEIDACRALKECHLGAVYLHSSLTWLVEKCDIDTGEVVVSPFQGSFHTRPMSEKQTEILEVFNQKSYAGYGVSLGKLLVREKVTGYQKRNNRTNKLIATIPLSLPEQYLETVGLWIEIPETTRNEMEEAKLHFMGGIHALEHAMIGKFPLLVLCDRNDIGGISCPVHHQTAGSVVFVYDGYSGGMGLCSEAFLRIEELLSQTGKTVESCSCKNGCPSCVHSPKCGSGNRPIDKAACVALVNLLRNPGSDRFAVQGFKKVALADQALTGQKVQGIHHTSSPLTSLPAHYGVFDLETKYSALEVGGWHQADKMGISVAVIYDSLLNDYVTYLEDEVEQLIEHLLQLDLVVGFNNRRFDNHVLAGYTNKNLSKMAILDLLEVVKNRLGYRLSLDRLARHTLGTKKTADGLQALEWYKQGEIEKISRYCKKDVAITRDLLLHGLEHGFLLFQNKAGKVVRLPIDLETEILKEAKRDGFVKT
jgi:DEAD/DEAH box helicase domain-containing protein